MKLKPRFFFHSVKEVHVSFLQNTNHFTFSVILIPKYVANITKFRQIFMAF